jgi:ATP:ADP antiporter, AAA family
MDGMLAKITSFFPANRYERIKVLMLSLTFLFVVGAYTVIYDLKNSIFMSIVGKEYIPWAKMSSMIILVPAVLFYAFLVDNLRRYQLLCFYSIAYGIFGLICAYLLGHPIIGLPNTDSSPFRIFGWLFYFFVEGFSPFMVSVFWAFANSVNSPDKAKNNYGLIVLGSKMGGMLSASFSCWLLMPRNEGSRWFSDATNHQLLLLLFSTLIIIVPLVVYYMIGKVPSKYLHGYEAVYQFEKEKKKEGEAEGLLDGLMMLLQKPYILGIFGMVLFYEILNTILGYQRLAIAQAAADNVSGVSYILYQQMFYMHSIGFFITLFGTNTLLRLLGERICLMLIPFVSGILLFYFWMTYTPLSLMMVFVVLKSVNYAFAQPVRESLYIPTVKDIKFKSKSWIDAFGQKMARGLGSGFNVMTDWMGPLFYFPVHGALFVGVILAWLGTAFLLGKRYDKAIKQNEIIS